MKSAEFGHFGAVIAWQGAHKAGSGNYQTLINDALLEHVHRRTTLDAVRQVVREELAPYGIARGAGLARRPGRSARR